MIFFTDNKKIFGLFVLAAVVTIFIFVQSFKIMPITKVAEDNSQRFWEDINKQTGQTIGDVQDSWELGTLQSQELSEEMNREVDRQKLLEEAKDYVRGKQASTTATSTSFSN